jgi:hypothetical protein
MRDRLLRRGGEVVCHERPRGARSREGLHLCQRSLGSSLQRQREWRVVAARRRVVYHSKPYLSTLKPEEKERESAKGRTSIFWWKVKT